MASLPPPSLVKRSLDKDLDKVVHLEEATRSTAHRLAPLGLALVFLALAGGFASLQIGATPNALFIVVAAVLGGYMALNIGANDVANNVGPAVGSRALHHAGGAGHRRGVRDRRRADRRRRRGQDHLEGHPSTPAWSRTAPPSSG